MCPCDPWSLRLTHKEFCSVSGNVGRPRGFPLQVGSFSFCLDILCSCPHLLLTVLKEQTRRTASTKAFWPNVLISATLPKWEGAATILSCLIIKCVSWKMIGIDTQCGVVTKWTGCGALSVGVQESLWKAIAPELSLLNDSLVLPRQVEEVSPDRGRSMSHMKGNEVIRQKSFSWQVRKAFQAEATSFKDNEQQH